ncbi:hypothetical protein L1987_53428 [Smallanthus sonchifolius]|uniref:Uncharacterized protein n=1 Tax=Smallanthus sonchifolius TaxID=185202 RepID=A0ACB9EV81_9ASTR|nr:hypothetical protein L1987_53428 [Smallanthus sonchifolius]
MARYIPMESAFELIPESAIELEPEVWNRRLNWTVGVVWCCLALLKKGRQELRNRLPAAAACSSSFSKSIFGSCYSR